MECRHHQWSPRQREVHRLRPHPEDLHAGLPHEEGGEEHRASPQLRRGTEPSGHHAPVAGATKLHHVEGSVKAVDLTLTDEDRNYLEELYVPHPLVGVMAQNTKNADREGQAWAKHAPKE